LKDLVWMRYLCWGDLHLLNILWSQAISYVTNTMSIRDDTHPSMKRIKNNVISLYEKWEKKEEEKKT